MIIETERLFLREMKENDFDSLYEVLADADIMQHYPYTFDKNRVRNWKQSQISDIVLYFFVSSLLLYFRQKYMADFLGCTHQNANKLYAKLLQDDYIVSQQDENDHRKQRIY